MSGSRVTAFGETHTLRAWADKTGLDEPLIRKRIELGWNAEKALSEPPAGSVDAEDVRRRLERLERLGLRERFAAICLEEAVEPEEIFGRRGTQRVSKARHRLMAWFRSELRWSFPEIAALFNRDHASVMSALRRRTRRSAA